jgi:hypothetical protein
MLLHKRNANQRQDSKRQQCEPNTPEGLHERAYNSIIPSIGEMTDFIEIVSDATDLICGAGLIAKPLPKSGFENVLIHG